MQSFIFVFQGEEELPVMHIHRQSAYLIGRDAKIADIPVLHPSCSKQHAVLQYRLVSVDLPDGTAVKKTRPYIIDLNSANGTYLNDERIEPQRCVYYTLSTVLVESFLLLNNILAIITVIFIIITVIIITIIINGVVEYSYVKAVISIFFIILTIGAILYLLIIVKVFGIAYGRYLKVWV